MSSHTRFLVEEDLAKVVVSFDGKSFLGCVNLPYLDKKAYLQTDPKLRSFKHTKVGPAQLAQRINELINTKTPFPPPSMKKPTKRQKLRQRLDRKKGRDPRLRGAILKGVLWSERRARREAEKKAKKAMKSAALRKSQSRGPNRGKPSGRGSMNRGGAKKQ